MILLRIGVRLSSARFSMIALFDSEGRFCKPAPCHVPGDPEACIAGLCWPSTSRKLVGFFETPLIEIELGQFHAIGDPRPGATARDRYLAQALPADLLLPVNRRSLSPPRFRHPTRAESAGWLTSFRPAWPGKSTTPKLIKKGLGTVGRMIVSGCARRESTWPAAVHERLAHARW